MWHRGFQTKSETCLLSPDTWQGFGGDCVHALQTHVVSGVTENAPLENLAEDYLKVIEIEQAVYESAKEGRKISLG